MSRKDDHIMSPDVPDCSRKKKGNFLVEAAIGIGISVIMFHAVFAMYVGARRSGNMSQAQATAQCVAQECIDQVRGMPFDTVLLNGGIGTHYAYVNGSPPADEKIFVRPLFHDSTLTYTALPASIQQAGIQVNSGAMFHTASNGTLMDDKVLITIAAAAVDASGKTVTILVTVTVNYLDSSAKIKTYTINSYISSTGLTG